jgi:hypothetical protein
MTIRRVYVAGPMRGVPDFNFPAFASATARLREVGFEVFSPAERDLNAGFDPTGLTGNEDLAAHGFDLRHALAVDLDYVCRMADAVAVLPGWERSSGARAEVAAARALGLDVLCVGRLLDLRPEPTVPAAPFRRYEPTRTYVRPGEEVKATVLAQAAAFGRAYVVVGPDGSLSAGDVQEVAEAPAPDEDTPSPSQAVQEAMVTRW